MKYLKTYNESNFRDFFFIPTYNERDKLYIILDKLKQINLIKSPDTNQSESYINSVLVCKLTGKIFFSTKRLYQVVNESNYEILNYKPFINGGFDEEILQTINVNKMGLM